jgi:hypothetical protein
MASTDRMRHIGPRAGQDAAAALDQALAALSGQRRLDWPDDPAAALHLLASLQRQIQDILPRAVADARAQGCSWAEIGDLLGVTRAAAWNRHSRQGGRGSPDGPAGGRRVDAGNGGGPPVAGRA